MLLFSVLFQLYPMIPKGNPNPSPPPTHPQTHIICVFHRHMQVSKQMNFYIYIYIYMFIVCVYLLPPQRLTLVVCAHLNMLPLRVVHVKTVISYTYTDHLEFCCSLRHLLDFEVLSVHIKLAIDLSTNYARGNAGIPCLCWVGIYSTLLQSYAISLFIILGKLITNSIFIGDDGSEVIGKYA